MPEAPDPSVEFASSGAGSPSVAWLSGLPQVEGKATSLEDFQSHRRGQQLQEVADILKYRRAASIWAGALCTLAVLFQYVLLFLVGNKLLDFSGYDNLLQWVIVTNFGQIIGLVYIVFNFLFPGAKKDASEQD